jgi:hypothetical protein
MVVASLKLRPFYLWENSRYPVDMTLGLPQKWSTWWGGENPCSCWELCPSLRAVLTDLTDTAKLSQVQPLLNSVICGGKIISHFISYEWFTYEKKKYAAGKLVPKHLSHAIHVCLRLLSFWKLSYAALIFSMFSHPWPGPFQVLWAPCWKTKESEFNSR